MHRISRIQIISSIVTLKKFIVNTPIGNAAASECL